MKKADWRNIKRGSPKYVYLHGLWSQKRGKALSAILLLNEPHILMGGSKSGGIKTEVLGSTCNPKIAFERAERIVNAKSFPESRSRSHVETMMDQSGFSRRNPGYGSEHFDPMEYNSFGL